MKIGKGAVAALVVSQVLLMSLWFSGAAILPALVAETGQTAAHYSGLASFVQIGFVAGALLIAVLGLADKFDRRRLMSFCGFVAAFSNLLLIYPGPDHVGAYIGRFLVGAALAGVYPVGMAIAASWGLARRGLMVGLLVSALAFGGSLPHLAAFMGDVLTAAGWTGGVLMISGLAALGAVVALFIPLGSHLGGQAKLSGQHLLSAWREVRVRGAYLGYLGHMWELYAFWAWIGVALGPLAVAHIGLERADSLVTFALIASGAVGCVAGSFLADGYGKARLARVALAGSAIFGFATALSLAFGPWWLTLIMAVGWGVTIIPDSPQFSALVADYAPTGQGASLLVFQTALGFALTAVVVDAVPGVASAIGWPLVLAVLACGPVLGWLATGGLAHIERVARGLVPHKEA